MSWRVTSASTQVRNPSSAASACVTSAAVTTWQRTSVLTPARSLLPARFADANLPAATRGKDTQRSTYGRRTRKQRRWGQWSQQQPRSQQPHLPPATPLPSLPILLQCLLTPLQSPPATPLPSTLPTHLHPSPPPTHRCPCQAPFNPRWPPPSPRQWHPTSTAPLSPPRSQTCRPPFPQGQSRSAKNEQRQELFLVSPYLSFLKVFWGERNQHQKDFVFPPPKSTFCAVLGESWDLPEREKKTHVKDRAKTIEDEKGFFFLSLKQMQHFKCIWDSGDRETAKSLL